MSDKVLFKSLIAEVEISDWPVKHKSIDELAYALIDIVKSGASLEIYEDEVLIAALYLFRKWEDEQ